MSRSVVWVAILAYRPVDMYERDIRSNELDLHFGSAPDAVLEIALMAQGMLLLNLRSALPVNRSDVDRVCVLYEHPSESCHVMGVPGSLELHCKCTDLLLIGRNLSERRRAAYQCREEYGSLRETMKL